MFRNETLVWQHIKVEGEDKEIVCTPEHPFFVLNATAERNVIEFEGCEEKEVNSVGSWVAAKDLRISDKLLLSNGKEVIIEKIEVEKLEKPVTTYNFEVADFHTYYVGEQGILVHNACGPKSPQKLSKSEIKKFDAELYKEGYVGNKGSRFDIFKDTASNNKIWLGDKSQKVWIETYEYLPDLFSGGW